MEVSQHDLVKLLEESAGAGLRYIDTMFFYPEHTTIEEYIESSYDPNNVSTCQEAWDTPTLTAHCKECGIEKNCCICINCYLHSNHEGHHVTYHHYSCGNCDCGDCNLWRKDGFCSKHSQQDSEPHMTQLDEPTRRKYELTFGAVARALIHALCYKPKDVPLICSWFKKFTALGSGVRRMCTLALIDVKLMHAVLDNITLIEGETMKTLNDFLGSIMNDESFTCYFSTTVIGNAHRISDFVSRAPDMMSSQKGLKKLLVFMFHGFSRTKIREYFLNGGPDNYIGALNRYIGTHRLAISTNDDLQKDSFDMMFNLLERYHNILEALTGDKRLSHIVQKHFNTLFSSMSVFAQFCYIDEEPTSCCTKRNLPLADFFDRQMDLIASAKYKIDPSVLKQAVIYPDDDKGFCHFLPLHTAISAVIRGSSNSQAMFREIIGSDENIEQFCLRGVKLIKHLQLGQIEEHSDYFKYLLKFVGCKKRSSWFRTLKIFSTIQTSFLTLENCDSLLLKIAKMYQVFDDEKANHKRTAFLFFIASLMTDSISFNDDPDAFRRHRLTKKLISAPQDFSSLSNALNGCPASETSDDDIIQSVCKMENTQKGTLFKLIDRGLHNPFIIYQSLVKVCTQMNKVLSKGPKELYPFPEVIIRKLLDSKVLDAIYFHILLSTPSDQIMEGFHVIGNIFLERANNSRRLPQGKPIIADTFESLVAQMPENVYQVISTPITYGNHNATTFSELFGNFGPAGEFLLGKLNLNKAESSSSSPAHSPSERASALRMRLQAEYNQRISSFAGKIEDDQKEDDKADEKVCTVCHCPLSLDELVYPATITFNTLVRDFEQRCGGPEKDMPDQLCSIFLCQHMCHFGCIDDPEGFKCPNDRLKRNALIPLLPPISQQLSENQRRILTVLIDTLNVNASDKGSALISSIIALFITTEVRLRNNPDCLSLPQWSILLSIIFPVAYHTNKHVNAVLSNSGPFFTFFNRLLMSPNPAEEFMSLAQGMTDEITLRRIALLKYFAFTEQSARTMELDEYLSLDNLRAMFNVAVVKCDLPPFTLLPIPRRVIEFGKEPYSVNVANYSKRVLYCMVSGKYITFDKDYDRDVLFNHSINHCNGNPTILIGAAGKSTGATIFVSANFNIAYIVQPVYLDQYGAEDVGFQRGVELYLNQRKLDKYVDDLISGRWSDLALEAA